MSGVESPDSAAENDALRNGLGFLLKTSMGYIHVPFDKARVISDRGFMRVECDIPLLADQSSKWIVLIFDGADIVRKEFPD